MCVCEHKAENSHVYQRCSPTLTVCFINLRNESVVVTVVFNEIIENVGKNKLESNCDRSKIKGV